MPSVQRPHPRKVRLAVPLCGFLWAQARHRQQQNPRRSHTSSLQTQHGSSLTPIGHARFAPGRVFAARFRVVSLFGRGAMGEVYRRRLAVGTAGRAQAPHWPRTAARVITTGRSRVGEGVLWVVVMVTFGGTAIMVRRHLHAGEGDLHGARTLATLAHVGGVVSIELQAHHVPDVFQELLVLLSGTGWCVVWSAISWLAYVAFEPLRRTWPAVPCDRRLAQEQIATDAVKGKLSRSRQRTAVGVQFPAWRLTLLRAGLGVSIAVANHRRQTSARWRSGITAAGYFLLMV